MVISIYRRNFRQRISHLED